MIEYRRPWTRQPHGVVSVRSEYDAPGSVVVVPGHGVITGNAKYSEDGLGLLRSVGRSGIEQRAAASAGWANLGKLPRLSPGAATFVLCIERTSGTFRYLAGTVDTGAAYIDQIAVNSSPAEAASAGNLFFALRSSSGAYRSGATTSAPLALDTVHGVVLQVESPTSLRAWVDGVEHAVTYSSTGSPGASAGVVEFDYALHNRNVRGSLSSGETDTRVYLFARLATNRLDPVALSRNPWSLFEPRRILVPVQSAPPVQLDIDAAAVSLSGSVAISGDINFGTSFDVAAASVDLAGSLAVSGDIQITEAPELDLDPATLALSGALSVSGDIEIGTSHDLAADPVALSGALAVSGDIEASVDPALDIDASAIALSGSLAVSGDIDIGTSFDVEASAVALAGAVSVSGDIEIGATFDLAIDPVALAGSLDLAGDIEASDTPVQSGILEIEWEPNLWWKRKPKALPEKVVREKLKKAATVIAKKAEEQVKADVVAEKEQRKAEAREAVRPMLAEMPGFDWQALYDEAYSRALNAAVAQAMREQEAMAQAKAAIDRARLLDDEDVEILMAIL